MLRILWPGLPPFEQRLRKHCLEYMRAELAHEVVSVIYAWWKRMTSYPISSSYEHRQWHPSRLDLGALRLMKLWNVSVGSWQPVIAVNGDIPDIDPSFMPPLTSQAAGFIEPSSPELSAALNTTLSGRQSPPKIGSPHEHAFHPYSRPPSQSRTQSYRQMPQIYARTSQGHAERMQMSPPSNAWIHPQSPLPPHLQGHSQMPLTRSSDPLSQPNDHPAFATSSNYATVPDYDIIPQRSLVSRSALAFMSMKAISFVGLPHKTPGANLHALLAPENAVSCVQHAHGGVFVSDVINGNSSFVVRLEWPGLPLWEEQVLGYRFTRGEVAHHVATVIYKWWKSAKTMPLPNDLDLHKWHPSALCFRSIRLLELRGIAPGIWQPVCAVDRGSVEHDQGTQKGRTQSQGRRTSEEHSRANGAASIPNDMPRPTYY
ncbi:hypothetical protein PHLGIDRAFT_130122 [Phlebiopsis gigantea 11061_1 CR5-6]|uniref:Uncharacterized protein n=1 Tax=Phlebiopsis gigantea (strain 11061_1 CR5-6) TaxID=745531 RepID=A0A0C3RSP9_PHLG1|nr:hypothetical protein PHLGIDRAFT_130122 [Phlebiopsis gigantea 11061_1 CR5-6]